MPYRPDALAELHHFGCLAIEQLELDGPAAWPVHLEPHPGGISQPQVPDWFGYRPI